MHNYAKTVADLFEILTFLYASKFRLLKNSSCFMFNVIYYDKNWKNVDVSKKIIIFLTASA